MRIKSLHIKNFGRFTDTTLSFPEEGAVMIHGPNEAGKSTLMAFIKFILFGFPTRQELIPYAHSKPLELLGGSVTFLSEIAGEVLIERNYGDKDVKAFSTQLPLQGEALLQSLYQGIDRHLFESIFWFDLDGLRDLEKVRDDELNHYLFSTGMMGSTRIYQLEKKLLKQQGELFKPSGKNPEMNQLLTRLETLQEKTKVLVKGNEQYELKRNEMDIASTALKETEDQIKKVNEELKSLHMYLSLKPLLIEQERLIKRLRENGEDLSFPVDGVMRLENLQRQYNDYKGESLKLLEQVKAIQSEIRRFEKQELFLSRERDFEVFFKKSSYYDRMNQELLALKEKDQEMEYQIHDQLATLGKEWSLSDIEAINVNIEAKEQLQNVLGLEEEQQQKLQITTQELHHSKQRLAKLSEQIERERTHFLSPEERRKLEEQIQLANEKNTLEVQKITLKEHLKNQESQRKRSKRAGDIIALGAGFLGILFAFIFISMYNTFIGATGGLFLIILGIMGRWWVHNIRNTEEEFKELNQLNEIDQKLSQLASVDQNDLKYRLQEETRAHIMVEMYQQQYQDELVFYNEKQQQLSKNSMEVQQSEREWSSWLERVHFPSKVSPIIVQDMFETISQIQQAIREKDRLFQKIQLMEKEQEQEQKQLKVLLESIGADSHLTMNQIEDELRKEKRARNVQEQLRQKHIDREEQLDLLQGKEYQVKEEISNLFSLAKVENEEDFRQKHKRVQENKDILARLEILEDQIRIHIPSTENYKEASQRILQEVKESKEGELNEKHQKLEADRHHLQQRLSDLKSELKQMEESHLLSQHLHTLKNEQSVFNQKAKRWAVYQTALVLLRTAKERYRAERLPKLLQTAAQYFSLITSGKYQSIFIDEKGIFSVQNETSVLFKVNELSRGTQEQLYLALRLALADLFGTTTFPIIIDDSFVNFDEKRFNQTMKILEQIASTKQVLFFTCKERLIGNPSMTRVALMAERKISQ